MKRVLPWLVRWVFPASARVFHPGLAALVSKVKHIFSSPYTISIYVYSPPGKTARTVHHKTNLTLLDHSSPTSQAALRVGASL
jgi:hypothetical protein